MGKNSRIPDDTALVATKLVMDSYMMFLYAVIYNLLSLVLSGPNMFHDNGDDSAYVYKVSSITTWFAKAEQLECLALSLTSTLTLTQSEVSCP